MMAEIRSSVQDTRKSAKTNAQLSAGLYVVATPIGNLGDITTRALDTLRSADVIACEDTRVTAKLLNAFLIKKPLLAYHEHNGATQRPRLLDMIADGKAVALVSDAGTPLISDPGFKLVSDAANAGFMVTTLPGPCAVIAALTLAGLATDRFLFLGFSPNKSNARCMWFEAEKDTSATLVFYESTRRLPESLKDAHQVFGARQVVVCREITKHFEEVVRGDLSDVAAIYAESGAPKGEVVVVIEGKPKQEHSQNAALPPSSEILEAALKHNMSVKSAAAFVAELTGEKKKGLYQQALEITNREST
jgi:16S rRNA (cytidine1402-2'-O)-methyltransferase